MTVFKSFPILHPQGQAHIAHPATFYIGDSLAGYANGLFEAVGNLPAPGSASVDIEAHDHRGRGVLIPAGPLFVADWGEGQLRLTFGGGDADSWVSWNDRPSVNAEHRFPAWTPFYVPEAMTASLPGNGPGGRVRLRMFLDCLKRSGFGDVEVRVVTRKMGDTPSQTPSDASTVSSTTYTEMGTEIENIVPRGGWNEFQLQIRTSDTNTWLDIRALALVATEEDSRPDTGGTYFFNGPNIQDL